MISFDSTHTLLPSFGQATSTRDTRRGVLLRIHRDEHETFFASDLVGLRFGAGRTVDGALDEWWAQVADILSIPDDELGEPLRGEVAAYREALGGD